MQKTNVIGSGGITRFLTTRLAYLSIVCDSFLIICKVINRSWRMTQLFLFAFVVILTVSNKSQKLKILAKNTNPSNQYEKFKLTDC